MCSRGDPHPRCGGAPRAAPAATVSPAATSQHIACPLPPTHPPTHPPTQPKPPPTPPFLPVSGRWHGTRLPPSINPHIPPPTSSSYTAPPPGSASATPCACTLARPRVALYSRGPSRAVVIIRCSSCGPSRGRVISPRHLHNLATALHPCRLIRIYWCHGFVACMCLCCQLPALLVSAHHHAVSALASLMHSFD